jgi:hypothetical protein
MKNREHRRALAACRRSLGCCRAGCRRSAPRAPYPRLIRRRRSRSSCRTPAGGATDVLARMVGAEAPGGLGTDVVVENRPGPAAPSATTWWPRRPADGHTVLITITALIQQPPLMANLPYDPFKDFAPITRIAISPSMLAVPPSTPANTLKDFVALVKASRASSTTAPMVQAPRRISRARC